MSIIDKAVAAVTPPESDEARLEANAKARAAAQDGDWLSHVLDHHDQIRQGLAAAFNAPPAERPDALKRLARILVGHSLAEEIVLYPALSKAHEKGHAMMAYTEQTATKMQMAELERLDPGAQEWEDKLDHIRGALLHHMYEEEGNWFLDLKRQSGDSALWLTDRFLEEYERYVGGEDGTGLRGSAVNAQNAADARPI